VAAKDEAENLAKRAVSMERSTLFGSWIVLDNLGYLKELMEAAASQPNFLPRVGMRYHLQYCYMD